MISEEIIELINKIANLDLPEDDAEFKLSCQKIPLAAESGSRIKHLVLNAYRSMMMRAEIDKQIARFPPDTIKIIRLALFRSEIDHKYYFTNSTDFCHKKSW